MVINNTENVQSESLLEEVCVDDSFICSICSLSFTSQKNLEEHFLTHIDNDFFFQDNTDIKRVPRDEDSSPSYLNFNKNKQICTRQPSYNKNIPVHIRKEPYNNKQSTNFTTYSKNNDQADIECKIINKRKICSFCDEITYGEENYRQHALIHYTKTGKLRESMKHFTKSNGPKHIKKTYKNLKNIKKFAFGDKSKKNVEKIMENSVKNIQYIHTDSTQQLITNYNSDKDQILLNKLISNEVMVTHQPEIEIEIGEIEIEIE